jgi:lipoate-protein ligase A
MSRLKLLPTLASGGGAQMALDDGLLETAETAIARRYLWSPPALSLGKFQKLDLVPGLPFDVVRRPSGGRAVLHGEAFEWSFAFVFAFADLGSRSLQASYRFVNDAFAHALTAVGVTLDPVRAIDYRRSGLCFATALRHDLMAAGDKVVALAQARRGGRVLVHGSVLERRPPIELVTAVEALLGEPWLGDGLAAAGVEVDGEQIWARVLSYVDTALAGEVAPA